MPRRLIQGLGASRVREIRCAGTGDGESIDRFEPAQRPAQESDRRHQKARCAEKHGQQHRVHKAVIVEMGQPAQEAVGIVDTRSGHQSCALREDVRVCQNRATRCGGRPGGVLQIGDRLRSQFVRRRAVRERRRRLAFERDPAVVCRRPFGMHLFAQAARAQDHGRTGIGLNAGQTHARGLPAQRIGRRDRNRDAPGQHAGPERAHEI